jgi:hypothetical protein
VPRLLTDVFFAPLRVMLETADITRPCHSLDDLTFALLGVLRALQASAEPRPTGFRRLSLSRRRVTEK